MQTVDITVGKKLNNLCFSFILGILVVPKEVKTVLIENFFSGGEGGSNQGIFWEIASLQVVNCLMRLSLLKEIWGLVPSLKTPKLSPAQKTITAVTQDEMHFASF